MFTMYDYIKNTLEELLGEWMLGGSLMLPANHLFSVEPDSKKLAKKNAVFFHHNVSKPLFLLKRARPDIQPTIVFLYK